MSSIGRTLRIPVLMKERFGMMVFVRRHVVGIATVALFALGFGAMWWTGASSMRHLIG